MGMVVVPESDQSIAANSTTLGPNITIDAGRTLTRGSWNAQPYVTDKILFEYSFVTTLQVGRSLHRTN